MQLQTAGIDFDVTGSSLVAVPVTTDFMLADDPVAAASYAHQLRSFSSPQSAYQYWSIRKLLPGRCMKLSNIQ